MPPGELEVLTAVVQDLGSGQGSTLAPPKFGKLERYWQVTPSYQQSDHFWTSPWSNARTLFRRGLPNSTGATVLWSRAWSPAATSTPRTRRSRTCAIAGGDVDAAKKALYRGRVQPLLAWRTCSTSTSLEDVFNLY